MRLRGRVRTGPPPQPLIEGTQDLSEAGTSGIDIDAATAAKLAYHAFSVAVIATETGDPGLAALSREIVFETLDLPIERGSMADGSIPEMALPTA